MGCKCRNRVQAPQEPENIKTEQLSNNSGMLTTPIDEPINNLTENQQNQVNEIMNKINDLKQE